MRKQLTPWEGCKEECIPAVELKKRSTAMTNLLWFMCAFLVAGGLTTPYKITIVFAVLCMLALCMDKQAAATPRGIEVFYDMRITTNYVFWPWKEITGISYEENSSHPDVIAVYFFRDTKSKRMFFEKKDWSAVLTLARKGNLNLEKTINN